MMNLKIKQNKEIRDKNYIRIINRKIQNYIKNPVGNLDLWVLPISKLPNNLKLINGSLNISYTNITKLPRELVINGSLCMSNTNISELPRELVINGDLSMSKTNISELPEDIIINGDLFCYDSPLGRKYSEEELENKYNIKGYIYGT